MLAHLAMSSFRYCWNSGTLIDMGTAPCAAQADLTSGRATILRISALSRFTISGGVALGAMMPSQIVASYFGTPASDTVGRSGVIELRTCPVVARPRTLPSLASGAMVVTASNIRSTWPPTTSVRAPELPLYGMWVILTPAMYLNNSPAMWYGV